MNIPQFIQKLFMPHKDEIPQEITIPDNLFLPCPHCKTTLFRKKLLAQNNICPECGFHLVMSSEQWIKLLMDTGSWNPLFENLQPVDPLQFPGYQNRCKQILKSHPHEAIVTGSGLLGAMPVLLGVMDPNFLMGSMGSVVGEKITRLFERAIEEKRPVILVVRSGGARMQEGVLSLFQMAKTSAVIQRFHQAGLLYISLLTHPTTGGVSASFAMLGDIILAEPNALIGFAGPRVIEQTIRQELPEGFQKSEYLLEKGFLDAVVHRHEMRATLQKMLTLHACQVQPTASTSTSLLQKVTQWIRKH